MRRTTPLRENGKPTCPGTQSWHRCSHRRVKTHTGLRDLAVPAPPQRGSGLPGSLWVQGPRERGRGGPREGQGCAPLGPRAGCLPTADSPTRLPGAALGLLPSGPFPGPFSWGLGLVCPAQPALCSCFVSPKSRVPSRWGHRHAVTRGVFRQHVARAGPAPGRGGPVGEAAVSRKSLLVAGMLKPVCRERASVGNSQSPLLLQLAHLFSAVGLGCMCWGGQCWLLLKARFRKPCGHFCISQCPSAQSRCPPAREVQPPHPQSQTFSFF